MITIFGPESFYPFGALKKFASCFRQHPVVTMWQTLFSTNILENSSTKRIFHLFKTQSNMRNCQRELLILFNPKSKLLVEAKKYFRKVSSDQVKSCFCFKVAPQTKKILARLVYVFSKKGKCLLFDNLSNRMYEARKSGRH